MAARLSVNGWRIRSLAVVAGPTAVGKSRFLQALTRDGAQRNRLRVPNASLVVTGGGFVRVPPPGPIDELILHYDILRPHHKGFGSHAADPATSILHQADSIAFYTLKTTQDRLAAQLDERLAPYKRPPKKLRKLRPLYDHEWFLADWYDRWFTFVERFRAVTTGHDMVDTDSGYRFTPVSARPLLPDAAITAIDAYGREVAAG